MADVAALPEYLLRLRRLFQQLNLLYHFLRIKTTASLIPVEKLLTGLEANTQETLTLGDWVAFQAVDPSVQVLYLAPNFLATLTPNPAAEFSQKPTTTAPQRPSAYLRRGNEVLAVHLTDAVDPETPAPKRARKGRGIVQRPTVPSALVVTKWIHHYNSRFDRQLSEFWQRCTDRGSDPAVVVATEARERFPHLTVDPRPMEPTLNTAAAAEGEPEFDVPTYVEKLKARSDAAERIPGHGYRVNEARVAEYASVAPIALDPRVLDTLRQLHSVESLYSHQAAAIEGVLDGRHVVISTATASGKSLVFQAPILHTLLQDPSACALAIYPTKALTQDQIRAFRDLLAHHPNELGDVTVAVYDGDTPTGPTVRSEIRERAAVVFTNPDMLHTAILPHHPRWQRFLSHLRYVVLDELHVYQGDFGAHVAWILRRLQRLCRALGNPHAQFIASSATIADPGVHLRTLAGIPLHSPPLLVDREGSAAGPRHLLLWRPSNPNHQVEVADRLLELLRARARTLVFCKSRRACELVFQLTRERLRRDPLLTPFLPRIFSYRGGYLPAQRRLIESQLFHGELLAVIATNALELGIDVGQLDAVVMCGVPTSLASFHQQAGRAGRRGQGALVLVVPDLTDAWDSMYAQQPQVLFEARPPDLALDIYQPAVCVPQLQCAAFERKIDLVGDVSLFGDDAVALVRENLLHDTDGETYFGVLDTTHDAYTVIEELELSRALFTVYEDGVFLFQGRNYTMDRVVPAQRAVLVRRSLEPWYTIPQTVTRCELPTSWTAEQIVRGVAVGSGRLEVITQTLGFHRFDIHTNKLVETVERKSPELAMPGFGMWVDLPHGMLTTLQQASHTIGPSLHAIYHCLAQVLPAFMPFSVRGHVYDQTHPDLPIARLPR
ncbi:ATP-dependent 3'-5' DNA helicase [Tieghemiomyces parasiticus]|uniref:ATP-dependent 3'-5' DNA helicase n=1 Tax=Tieghemiomyces parasiticus TaxID=78921 RepID=A0A9W8AG63_9FUNG|nr:ATP-dependent 3'-5' DNA helicase [Tieghemiomyces parasiticus]